MAIHSYISGRKRTSLPSSIAPVARSKPILYHLLTVRLDVSRLRLFLLDTISRYCPHDHDLIHAANELYHSVHSKVLDDTNNSRKNGSGSGGRSRVTSMTIDVEASESQRYEACYHELNDCIAIISTFLSSCIEPLTPQSLSEAHYLIGSINETLQQTEQAKQSYIKALWIITANSNSDIFSMEVLATTLHCLGRTYGLLGKHEEALCLLQNAQLQYSKLNIHKDHALTIDVQELIGFNGQRVVDIATTKRLQQKCWSSSLSTSTLTLILEDDESE